VHKQRDLPAKLAQMRCTAHSTIPTRFRTAFIMRRGCACELTACGCIDSALDSHQVPTQPLSQNVDGLSSQIKAEGKWMRMLIRDDAAA
jgi:hypothetical protein